MVFSVAMLLVASLFAIAAIVQTVRREELARVLRLGLEKAERDNCDMVRIPANQVRELGFKSRHGFDRDPKDFARKPGPHPATLRAANRRNLRRGG